MKREKIIRTICLLFVVILSVGYSTVVNAKYNNILMETVTEIDYASNLIVVKTFNGMAMAAGAAIDALKWNGILGCIAGDDTVFIAVRNEAFAKEISQRIQSLIMAN